MAKEKNGWKPSRPTCSMTLRQLAWNMATAVFGTRCLTTQEMSYDVKACYMYPASFQGQGKTRPYFERFGHATNRMTRLAISGPLPKKMALDSPKLWHESSQTNVIPSSLHGLENISQRIAGPLTRHQLCYLNGGGSGKTMRAIEVFRGRDPLVHSLTHRLAKKKKKKKRCELEMSRLKCIIVSFAGPVRPSGLRKECVKISLRE